MLTPSFDITQDEHFVIVKIRVPYIKASEAEFHINDSEFKFYCKPYFLRLYLPGKVTEDGREKAVFDPDAGSMTVHLPKLKPREHFHNLGMLTTLLSKKPTKPVKNQSPLIEVLDTCVSLSCAGSDSESENNFDWGTENVLLQEDLLTLPSSLMTSGGYGFSSQHKEVFSKLQGEIPSIIDCPDPDHMTSHERRLARIAHEEMSFNPDHYLADLMDNDNIETLLKFEPPCKKELCKWKEWRQMTSESATIKLAKPEEAGQDIVPFSQLEREQLKGLPNKEYLLDKATSRCLYLGLIDIIFAYAYDHRTTEGEGNVESGWTICKLSPTLSWLEVYRGSVHEVVHSCLRRLLCYPLYRHWQLGLTVLQDTRDIFKLGRRKLLQCLLSVHRTLNSSDPYYILNNLYITDYCVWIQRASVKQIQSLADDLNEVTVCKDSLGWELNELEEAAQLILRGDTVSDGSTEGSSDGDSSDSTDTDDEESSCSDNEVSETESRNARNDSTLNDSEQEVSTDHNAQELTFITASQQQGGAGVLEQLLNLNIRDEPDTTSDQKLTLIK